MKNLRGLRLAAGMSMKAFGEQLGVAESTISLYENNKREPDFTTLARIADYFGVSIDYLLGREVQKEKPTTKIGDGPNENKTMVKMLRSLRKGRGITMKELGKIIGVSESAVSQYETDKREPDYSTLQALSDYFDVTIDYLLGRTEQKEKPTPVSEGGPSDDELIRLWTSLSPAEALRVKDFALGMIANRKEPPARAD